jgi:apolipoprotein D and lipocalin family protein
VSRRFVIGVIPTFIEVNAFNPIEKYELKPDGTMYTTFSYNQGSPTGAFK